MEPKPLRTKANPIIANLCQNNSTVPDNQIPANSGITVITPKTDSLKTLLQAWQVFTVMGPKTSLSQAEKAFSPHSGQAILLFLFILFITLPHRLKSCPKSFCLTVAQRVPKQI